MLDGGDDRRVDDERPAVRGSVEPDVLDADAAELEGRDGQPGRYDGPSCLALTADTESEKGAVFAAASAGKASATAATIQLARAEPISS